jgi:hypothetical protein
MSKTSAALFRNITGFPRLQAGRFKVRKPRPYLGAASPCPLAFLLIPLWGAI